MEFWDPIFPYSAEELTVSPHLIQSMANDPNLKTKPLDKDSEARLIEAVKEIKDPELRSQEQQRITRFIQLLTLVLDTQEGQPQIYDFLSPTREALITNKNVILGGLPKILHRIICGNSVSTNDLMYCFKNATQSYNEMKAANPRASLYDVADFLYPHIFQLPVFLYQALLLKTLARETSHVKMITGVHHVVPLYDMLLEDDLPATQFDEILCLPTRISDETVDELIHKYAILDVIHGDNLWAQPYITDKFPYLTKEEKTEIGDKELQKKFFVKHQKFLQLKKKTLESKE